MFSRIMVTVVYFSHTCNTYTIHSTLLIISAIYPLFRLFLPLPDHIIVSYTVWGNPRRTTSEILYPVA